MSHARTMEPILPMILHRRMGPIILMHFEYDAHCDSYEYTIIGNRWVGKGGFPHLVAKTEIMDGGW